MSTSSKESLLALCGSLVGLSVMAVSMRFRIRRQRKLPLMLDDWTAGAALLWYVGAAICVFTMIHNKILGYSSQDLTREQTKALIRTNDISQIIFDMLTNNTTAFVKLSALFFYRRVFLSHGVPSRLRGANWVTIVVIILWLTVFQFLTGFQCGTHLFSALWDGSYYKCCTISFPLLYGLSISDFLLDVWILALPIPTILRLHLTLPRRLYVAGIFLLAFAGLGASIARMVQFIQIGLGGPEALIFTDQQHLISKSFFYTMLECGMALIAVNLPSLYVIARSMMHSNVVHEVRSLVNVISSRGRPSQATMKAPKATSMRQAEEQRKNQSVETPSEDNFDTSYPSSVQVPIAPYFRSQGVGKDLT